MNKQPGSRLTKQNHTVQQLNDFVGEWDVMATHPQFPAGVHGRCSFYWLEESDLLIWRSEFERPGPPSALSVIGYDNSARTFSLLYSDDRPVSRNYGMSIEGSTWKLWREAPDFTQRFTGTLSDDGNTISGLWETLVDPSDWKPDLHLVFTRII